MQNHYISIPLRDHVLSIPSVEIPKTAKEYRCPWHNKLLFISDNVQGDIYIRHSHCSLLIRDGVIWWLGEKNIAGPRYPTKRRLTDEETFAEIEKRWETVKSKRAYKTSVLAAGIRFQVFQRDNFTCQYCGNTPARGALLEADHIVPRAKGGPDTLENLVTACWECNIGKRDTLLTGINSV